MAHMTEDQLSALLAFVEAIRAFYDAGWEIGHEYVSVQSPTNRTVTIAGLASDDLGNSLTIDI